MKKVLKWIPASFLMIILSISVNAQILNENTFKLGRTLGLIEAFYVDSADINSLTENAIVNMLRSLDPHSSYISAKDVKEMNEPLNGNFEGIGIQFNILHDTVIIIEPVKNGPSEKVGLKGGDRIITINDEKVTGIKITTTGVRSRLMGPKGTNVRVGIFRKGNEKLLSYTIIRDKIPINSLDAAYMLNSETGYIKLNKFAATTEKEFLEGLLSFNTDNLKNIIIDLRGNPGGYMLAAVSIANHFLEGQKLVVYMKGRRTPKEDFKSTGKGVLTKTRLVILTDEGSASASEILAGAMQDWDRGIIVGRRTFGKGLVQNAFNLTDGSQIRLTVARYYTPTGRSIQSPYGEGYTKYMDNYYKRFTNGETQFADSIHLPDSLRYLTMVNKRKVYGGGGLMPDVFVPSDTSYYTDYYANLLRNNIHGSFTLEYADKNRAKIMSAYPAFVDFRSRFRFSDEEIKAFIKMGEDAGVKFDQKQWDISKVQVLKVLKAWVANNLWQSSESFQVLNEGDEVIDRALKILADDKKYNSILGFN
jgi:carboxyl-terminal processing protease